MKFRVYTCCTSYWCSESLVFTVNYISNKNVYFMNYSLISFLSTSNENSSISTCCHMFVQLIKSSLCSHYSLTINTIRMRKSLWRSVAWVQPLCQIWLRSGVRLLSIKKYNRNTDLLNAWFASNNYTASRYK